MTKIGELNRAIEQAIKGVIDSDPQALSRAIAAARLREDYLRSRPSKALANNR